MANLPQRIDFEDFAAHVRQVFDQVKKQNHPVLIQRDGDTYMVAKQAPSAIRRGHQPTTSDDPLWTITQLADGHALPAGPTDVSEHVDKYLAEAYLPKDR